MSDRFIIYLVLLLFIAITGLYQFRQLSLPFRLLVILVIYTFLSETFSRWLIYYYRQSIPLYHLYVPVQFSFFLLIYSKLLTWSKQLYPFLIIGGFFILSMINLFYLQSLSRFPSNTVLLASTILILFSLFYFKVMLSKVEQVSIFRRSVFWFNSAVLLFFALAFVYWGFYNYLLKHKISTKPVTTIIYYVNLIFYSMLLVSIVLDMKRHKPVYE
jgi:hypothetical protein